MVWALVKINMKAMFASMFRRMKKGKRGAVSIILIALLVIYVFGAMFLMFGMMFHQMSQVFFMLGLGWFYFAMAGMLVFVLCFIGSVFMVQAQIFNAKDNSLLLPMPLKPSSILAGRVVSLLIFEYLYEMLIIIPAFVVLIINGYISRLPAAGILFFFAAAALLPLMSLAVGCLFGWIVALITSRMRNKNILTLVLSVVFLFAYFYFVSKLTGYMNALIENGAAIAEAVRKSLFPIYHMGRAVTQGSALSFFIFAVCAAAPFIIMCALLSHSFIAVATANKGARKVKYREKNLRVSASGTALLLKELRRFFANAMYILNASLGALGMLALAVFLIIKPNVVADILDQIRFAFPGVSAAALSALTLTALSALNYVSAPSISLEGKALWIARSLPVRTRDILLAKVALHVVVTGVPLLLAIIVCVFRFPPSGIMELIILFLAPISGTVLFAFLGLILNLLFPRFDWVNEIQPIKQGMSCILSMFGAMALIAALAMAYIFLLSTVGIDIFLLICSALFAALSAAMYIYLINGGCRRFESF